jgi:hypothetical protein
VSLTVVFRETALRNLARIRGEDKDLFTRTRRAISALADQPYPPGTVAWGATGVYRQILTWKHAALVVIAVLAFGASPSPVPPTVMFAVLSALCTAMALTSSLGRWLLVLLAIPGYPFFFTWAPFPIAMAFLPPDAAFIAKSYLPSLILLTLAVVTASRRPLRPA